MLSPTDLLKRSGVGGRLVPFFKAVVVYFALGGAPAAPSAAAVAAKCAPVLCLLLLVLFHHGPAALQPQGWYGRRVALGLALSALGDALLLWPEQFVAGMAAFGAAHVAYLAAFGFTPPAPLLAAVLYACTGAYLTLLEPPGALRVLVPLYSALLATMAWRGVARALHQEPYTMAAAGRWAQRAGGAGAALFMLSDAILGYSMFGGALRHKQALVMSTYYVGQLGIALSALGTHH